MTTGYSLRNTPTVVDQLNDGSFDMKWKCKDGREINISQMSVQHLRNTISMLRRKGVCTPDEFRACAAYAFSPLSGEYASMAAENQLDQMRPWSGLSDLEDELEKRT